MTPVDMFYKRMLNFVCLYLTSESLLVNVIVRHGITHGQMDSVAGRNAPVWLSLFHRYIEHTITNLVICTLSTK